MRLKKTAVVCMIVILALSAMGFGFAKWSDTVAIATSAQTGTLHFNFRDGSFFSKDQGLDWHSEMEGGMDNIFQIPGDEKDVGSTSGFFSDANNDGYLDTLTVTVENAYPCYYNEISAVVQCHGTVPIIIQKPVLTWMGNQYQIEDFKTYFLMPDGTISLGDGVPAPANAVLELRWMDNAGRQLHDGDSAEESWEFHVLQPAQQGTTYQFSVSVEGVQWNESLI